MKTQLTRGAVVALLLAGGSLLLAGNGEAQAREGRISAGTTLAQQPVDLSGTWKLNADKSDAPRNMGGNRGNRAGRSPRADGRPGRGQAQQLDRPGCEFRGARGKAGSRGPSGRQGERPRKRELTINQTDATVTVTRGRNRAVTITPDGQTVTEQARRGEAQITAKWEGEVLVVERSGPRGGTMTKSYQLSADGQQLTVTHKLEGCPTKESVEFRTVFDKT